MLERLQQLARQLAQSFLNAAVYRAAYQLPMWVMLALSAVIVVYLVW
jgi:hypothetical protein